ncbi:MAG: nucleotidyltransferase domain-containing protein [Francisellaceae bacterium]
MSDQTIAKIRGVFKLFLDIDEVVIFGSRAKGNYRPGSDIDLFIDGDGIDQRRLYQIDRALDELNLPYTFDLIAVSTIQNAALLSHIERAGQLFYRRRGEQSK